MAVDESTTIKTPTAKRTKAILSLGKLAKYRRILTGSPVTKSPLDLYTQCNFLHEELLGFNSYYTFRNRYAVMRNANFGGRRVQLVAGYQRLDELAKILKPFSDRVLKENCLDLPEKTYIERQVELTDEQKKTYATMKSAALASLKGKMATAPHVLTQLMRLHQITCGHLKNDDENQIHNLSYKCGNCELYNIPKILKYPIKEYLDFANEYGGDYKYRWGDNEVLGLFAYTHFDKPFYDFKFKEKIIRRII